VGKLDVFISFLGVKQVWHGGCIWFLLTDTCLLDELSKKET
jgi:hypothetical protein